MYYAYLNNSKIDDVILYERTAAQLAASGNPREIRDQVSTALGTAFTRSQYNNLKNYQLGGGLAAVNLECLLERVASFPGSRCVTVQGQDETVHGIIFQTEMQRKRFSRYGDSLVLDWTHNTNNLGFHLGM